MNEKTDREIIEEKMRGPLVGFFYCPICDKRSPVAHDCLAEFISDPSNYQSCCGKGMVLFTDRTMIDENASATEFERALGMNILGSLSRRLEDADRGCPCCVLEVRKFLINAIADDPDDKLITAVGRVALSHLTERMKNLKDDDTPH